MLWKKFLSYLIFWKKQENQGEISTNLKIMHGINRISILLFLFAMLVIAYRLIAK